MPAKNRHGSCCCGGGTAPITIGIPGCYCTAIPSSLSLTVTYGVGEDAGTYAHAFQDSTLAYYTTAPGYLPASAFGGAGFYSTTTWVDDNGFERYYRLNCASVQFALGLAQGDMGSWLAAGQIYSWSMGGTPAVNTCTPFELNQGHVQQGTAFNGKFVVKG